MPTTPAIAPMLIVFGMQEYGDSSQIMCAFFFVVGPQRLPDQHVALAAVEPAVEVRGGEPAELELVRESRAGRSPIARRSRSNVHR